MKIAKTLQPAVYVRFDAPTRAWLEALAAQEHRSMPSLIRHICILYKTVNPNLFDPPPVGLQ